MANLKIGDSFKSHRDGVFSVVDDLGWDNVLIIFPSGYKSKATRDQIKKGQVKDRYKPSIFSVGFIGGTKYKSKEGRKNTTAYERWRHMLARCYDSETQARMPTYKGCSVCDEWHNYQNYAQWFYGNKIDGCDVDKDILIDGNSVYSPDTCKFVPHQENSEKASAKTYKFISPDGAAVEIYNLNKFCRKNGLAHSNMHKVLNGERNHHKGWKKHEMHNR